MIPVGFIVTVSLTSVAIVATWFIARFYYRKQEYDRKILESLIGSDIRLRDDETKSGFKRGTVYKTKNGKYAVRWEVTLEDRVGISDSLNTKLKEKKDN